MPIKDHEKRNAYIREYKRRKRLERGLQKKGRKPLSDTEKEESRKTRRAWEKEWRKKYFELDVKKRLLWTARNRAKQKGVPCTISETDFEVPEFCPYLNVKLINHAPQGSDRSFVASLDRIIPSLGYIPGNVQVISHMANTMKSNATPEQLVQIAKAILARYDT